MIEELKLKAPQHRDRIIKTVFVGGGTPSRMPCGELTRIIEAVKNNYNFAVEEFSVEVNPVSFDIHHIKEYQSLGVNRISVGVQSLDDKILQSIGRAHNSKDAMTALGLATMYFDNVNADVMLGLPEQSVLSLVDTLNGLFAKRVQHISCYGLILEENTPLYRMVKSGEVKLPDEDWAVNMYNIAKDILEANGYNRYEISNFARVGYQCIHNKIYWYRDDYIGVGVAAHSLVGDIRSSNISSTSEYIETLSTGKLAVAEELVLSVEDKKTEAIMLALRCSEGLNIESFNREFNTDFLEEYSAKLSKVRQYISVDNNCLTIKPKHIYVSNSIISDLI
ncbi:MAG: radical SAM family heme chaperone HemW [Clostridia bacterium]|nr:radical SAM family heme chaperone HemW [Clostridia bacterium]